MISVFTFEETDRFSDQYPKKALRVHVGTGCGHGFKDIAVVLEPDSENPMLFLTKPLGVNAVGNLLAAIANRKK